jgi:hypothetical protein
MHLPLPPAAMAVHMPFEVFVGVLTTDVRLAAHNRALEYELFTAMSKPHMPAQVQEQFLASWAIDT